MFLYNLKKLLKKLVLKNINFIIFLINEKLILWYDYKNVWKSLLKENLKMSWNE